MKKLFSILLVAGVAGTAGFFVGCSTDFDAAQSGLFACQADGDCIGPRYVCDTSQGYCVSITEISSNQPTNQNQNRPENEGGKTNPGHGEGHRHVIEPGVGPQGGGDAGRHAENQRHQHGVSPQFERDWKGPANQLVHRTPLQAERGAEIAPRQIAEVVEVLPEKRLIEPVVRIEVFQHFRRGVAFFAERPPRRQPDHEKRDGRDQQEHRDDLQQTSGDQNKHAAHR